MCSIVFSRAESAGLQTALKDGVVCTLNASHTSSLHISTAFESLWLKSSISELNLRAQSQSLVITVAVYAQSCRIYANKGK